MKGHNRVGVFDSGVGGLSVVDSFLKTPLFKEIIYYGDTARVPYGSKDANTIIRYALEAVEFFKNFDIDLLVVACNSVSAYALDAMRHIAPFDVIGVIEPGVLALLQKKPAPHDSILIIGTHATIESTIYQTSLQTAGYTNITALATPLLVPVVEEQLYKGNVVTTILEHYFSTLTPPKYIILGCTHFPLLQDAISAYFNHHVSLIHSGHAIVEFLQDKKSITPISTTPSLKLFASENPDHLRQTAFHWCNHKV